MTVRVYRSSDYGAPTATHATNYVTGSVITLLDAVLVNGYGSQTVTSISASGLTATVTLPVAHGLKIPSQIIISGASDPAYNGTFPVASIPTTTTLTYTMTTTPSASPATGTITCKVAPAGWTKAFAATNRGAYQYPGGNQRYIDINDSTSANIASWRLYSSMTALSTGTNQTPTTTLDAASYLRKENNTTEFWWTIIVSDRFLLWYKATDSISLGSINFVGDIITEDTTDAWASVINTSAAASVTNTEWYLTNNFAIPSSSCYVYLPKKYGGLGTATKQGYISYNPIAATGLGSTSAPMPFPCSMDGKIYYSPVYITDPMGIRGKLPGVWMNWHATTNFANGDTFYGSGADSNRLFMVVNIGPASQVMLELSDTWYS